jgi:hypothetical protein
MKKKFIKNGKLGWLGLSVVLNLLNKELLEKLSFGLRCFQL